MRPFSLLSQQSLSLILKLKCMTYIWDNQVTGHTHFCYTALSPQRLKGHKDVTEESDHCYSRTLPTAKNTLLFLTEQWRTIS